VKLSELQQAKKQHAKAVARPVKYVLAKLAQSGQGEEIKKAIAVDLIDQAVDIIGKAVRGEFPFQKPEFWAVKVVLECAGAVESTPQVQIAVLNQLGVPLEEARRAVQVVADVESLTPEEKAEEAVQYLIEFNAKNPGREKYVERRGKVLEKGKL